MQEIADSLNSHFELHDFTRMDGDSWTRIDGVIANCIRVQFSSDFASVCICLGVHPTFLPPYGAANLKVASQFFQVDCEIQSRLSPRGTSDYWWPNKIKAKNIRSMQKMFDEEGRMFFEQYSQFPAPFDSVASCQLDSTVVSRILPGMTDVRRALFLARVAYHRGDQGEAMNWIHLGLQCSGPAVDPKLALESLKQQISQAGEN